MNELQRELNTLMENAQKVDAPYDKDYDKDVPEMWKHRKKVLRLCDVNKLKKIRNQKREELAQDSVFIAPLFGPQPEQGGGDMGMGL